MMFCSGRGANGGNPGLGGNGGNGANGGRVVIHTNDPSVLVLLEVNAGAGEGGKPGEHGKAGGGGQGGDPGQGGAKAVWDEYTKAGDTTQYRQMHGKEGREGKRGKNGKPGKNAPSRPSKAGKGGETGAVSFCLYDESGLAESSGTPFRVVLTKKDLAKLRPYARVNDVVCNRNEDRFVYGQELMYGPVLPVNIGGLECPMFYIVGTVIVDHTGPRSFPTKRPFPAIPAGTDTRNGTLPDTAAQQLILRLPTLKECGYECTGVKDWPWPQSNGKSPEAHARFNVAFEVNGLTMRQSEYDGNNACGKDYTVDLDIPVGFVEKNDKVIQAPVSISLSDPGEIDVSFTITNKMTVNLEKLSSYRCGINAAGFKFRPALRPASEVTKYEMFAPEGSVPEMGYLRRHISQGINSIEKQESVEYKFKLRLPEPTVPVSKGVKDLNNDGPAAVPPGSRLFLRGEIQCDEETCAFSVPTTLRVAPPLPSAKLPPSENDVLVFSCADMQVEDYEAIDKVCAIFGLNVHYVDLDHYLKPGDSTISNDLWAHLKGKATIVWAPISPDYAHRVPLAELQAHVTAGGALISGDCSLFTVTTSNFRYPTAGRRVINAGSAVQLTNLKLQLSVDESKIQGTKVVGFIAALLGSMSTDRKLRFLQNDPGHAQRAVNSTMLDSYQTVVKAGCCGMGGDSKVSPLIQKPCTVHDLVLASIRSDVSLDIHCCTTSAMDSAPAYKSVQTFAAAQILSKPASPAVAQLAADVYAVLAGAGVNEKKCPIKKPELALLANQCFTTASAGTKDPGALCERVKDVDVIQGCSRRRRGNVFGGKDPVDLSWGVAMFVYKGDPKQWF
jgi:hypothetical protein